MTDKFHYQDVFTTINIPKPERRLALKAKNLFDVAHRIEAWNLSAYAHLQHMTDSEDASQVFWELEDDANHLYDRLALTIMRRGLIIALEHRDFDDREAAIRASLSISNGTSKVYISDLRMGGRVDSGSTSEMAITDFKESFLDTTARLGLYSRIKPFSTDQNESSSAIFASAA